MTEELESWKSSKVCYICVEALEINREIKS